MYYQTSTYNLHDELLTDGENVRIENVSVTSGTAITRGTLLTAADFDSEFSKVTASVPAANVLVIAADDFDSDATVVSAYTSGNFHADKIITGDSVSIYDLKEHLRRENILLTERSN